MNTEESYWEVRKELVNSLAPKDLILMVYPNVPVLFRLKKVDRKGYYLVGDIIAKGKEMSKRRSFSFEDFIKYGTVMEED